MTCPLRPAARAAACHAITWWLRLRPGPRFGRALAQGRALAAEPPRGRVRL